MFKGDLWFRLIKNSIMKISSYKKIELQAENYTNRYMPRIGWLFPDYDRLEAKASEINKQFTPKIQEFCENLRNEKDTEQCFCSLHPQYDQWMKLITPVDEELKRIRVEYNKERSKMRADYEKVLLQSKLAKEKYAATLY